MTIRYWPKKECETGVVCIRVLVLINQTASNPESNHLWKCTTRNRKEDFCKLLHFYHINIIRLCSFTQITSTDTSSMLENFYIQGFWKLSMLVLLLVEYIKEDISTDVQVLNPNLFDFAWSFTIHLIFHQSLETVSTTGIVLTISSWLTAHA